MTVNRPARVVSLLLLASAALTAQVARQQNAVPLKNWATPLYWQPNQVEREAAGASLGQGLHRGDAAPQLQFSTNAVSKDALTFVAITPCRLADTRGVAAGFNGMLPFAGPSIAAGGTLTIPVQSVDEGNTNTAPAPCGVIPSIAQAYSFNLTVVPQASGAVDYVSLWPAGSAKPFVSTLDDPQGAIVSNAAIVPAGTPTGGISVFNSGPAAADVIIDMNGYFAAPSDVSGNTAIGVGTLRSDTTGTDNTASGAVALYLNTTGSYNTASGWGALGDNTTGSQNTASGVGALLSNSAGGNNTASGYFALYSNTTGNNNTASGFQALEANTTGNGNTAGGYQSLQANTTGIINTADGYFALQLNTTGISNTASGADALLDNTTGNYNTAAGANALGNNTTGSGNIAVGLGAALNVAGGNSNNIHMGSQGAAGDSGVVRIGTQSVQTSVYIAGISGASVSGGAEVFVNASGQLGTVNSSRRFKEQITGMGGSSDKLFQLRPVNFFYKAQYDDGSHLLQYGLIAEEVAKVYPEMVAYDNDGQVLTVKYQMLAPMLLNEVQKQHVQLQQQLEQNRKLEDRLAALEALLSSQTSTAPQSAGSQ
jgi:hypothetical protein